MPKRKPTPRDQHRDPCVGGRKILPKLTGRKRLILGNHDNGKDHNLHAAFQKISMWRMFPEFGALLSHVPLHLSALKTDMVNVHGHIHNRLSPTERHVNASVEAIGYRPIEIEVLLSAAVVEKGKSSDA